MKTYENIVNIYESMVSILTDLLLFFIPKYIFGLIWSIHFKLFVIIAYTYSWLSSIEIKIETAMILIKFHFWLSLLVKIYLPTEKHNMIYIAYLDKKSVINIQTYITDSPINAKDAT